MADQHGGRSAAARESRAEKQALRERMRGQGLGCEEIAAELARRYGMRPRRAWREAHGLTLVTAAERINVFVDGTGLNPAGECAMTAPHLSEYEGWPGPGAVASGRRPTLYVLAVMSAVYGAAPAMLVDTLDREHLRPTELLVLGAFGARPQLSPAGNGFEMSIAIAPRSARPGELAVTAR